jgi:hypothetical protein
MLLGTWNTKLFLRIMNAVACGSRHEHAAARKSDLVDISTQPACDRVLISCSLMSRCAFQSRLVHVLLVLLACGAASAGGDSSPSHLHTSIARILSSNMHAASSFHVVIRLKEAPLPPISVPSNAARAQAREVVALHLQQHRRSAQFAIREVLADSSCEFFWITNRISCMNISLPTLHALAQHPDVDAIHPPSAMRRPTPVSNAARPPSAATYIHASDLQPNIHQACLDLMWCCCIGATCCSSQFLTVRLAPMLRGL